MGQNPSERNKKSGARPRHLPPESKVHREQRGSGATHKQSRRVAERVAERRGEAKQLSAGGRGGGAEGGAGGADRTGR